MVPFDDKSPFVTSGIFVLERQLSPLSGLVEEDMDTIVNLKWLWITQMKVIEQKWLMKLTKWWAKELFLFLNKISDTVFKVESQEL
jgi:hypothetical protein